MSQSYNTETSTAKKLRSAYHGSGQPTDNCCITRLAPFGEFTEPGIVNRSNGTVSTEAKEESLNTRNHRVLWAKPVSSTMWIWAISLAVLGRSHPSDSRPSCGTSPVP